MTTEIPKPNIPPERRAKILTTETDEWIPLVARTILGEGGECQSCMLQGGDGLYILIGGVYPERSDPSIKRLINMQKKRPENRNIAVVVPHNEMSLMVADPYRDLISPKIIALVGEPFGLVVPSSDLVPGWLRQYDPVYRVWEKLLVWGDKTDSAPLARLYQYIRGELHIPSEEFFVIGTSANITGRRSNPYFRPAYEQLGDQEGLVYAVVDMEEEKYTKGSVSILSALPIVRGRERILVLRESRDIDGMRAKVSSIERMSVPARLLYMLALRMYRKSL